MSDEMLARLAGDGDDGAFAALYARYRAALSRYCRSILRDSADAEDAFQNAMVAAHRSLRREPLTGRVRPWLYRIAHNESISLIRRRPDEQPVAELPDTAVAGLDPAARERLQELLSDLQSLPENQRGALVLRELVGLDYEEIARVFAVSSVAARKSVYEARLSLARIDEGRQTGCAEIVKCIAEGDRRTLRSRRIRAHLRECSDCTRLERGIGDRRAAFALIPVAPLLPASGLGAVLGFGGGSAFSGGAATGLAAPGLGSGLLLKSLSAALAAVVAGGSLLAATGVLSAPTHHGASAATAVAGAHRAAAARQVASGRSQAGRGEGRNLRPGALRVPAGAITPAVPAPLHRLGTWSAPHGSSTTSAGGSVTAGGSTNSSHTPAGVGAVVQSTLGLTHTTLQRLYQAEQAAGSTIRHTLTGVSATIARTGAAATGAVAGTVQTVGGLAPAIKLP